MAEKASKQQRAGRRGWLRALYRFVPLIPRPETDIGERRCMAVDALCVLECSEISCHGYHSLQCRLPAE